jgi:Na/Pi-cotransporter
MCRIIRRLPVAWLVLASLITLLAGCSEPAEKTPREIVVTGGAAQIGDKGAVTEHPVELLVRGPRYGGAEAGRPVPGIRLQIAPKDGADAPLEATTDAMGVARVKVPFGKEFGDRYFEARCLDKKDVEPAEFRVTAGLSIEGNGQQTLAGKPLPEPIQVRVDGPGGKEAGTPVYFKLVSGSAKAKLNPPQTVTDEDGVATTMLETDPEYTGKYRIVAEVGVRGKDGSYMTRGVFIEELALNRWKLLIAVLGGLAFFIFGMKQMSQGLQMLAGARLKNILQMFTGRRMAAVAAGAGITALIQASGATSVMVVGFVNAGLMSLEQGIGVIMGSTIGTTITGQMVSFNLQSLAQPAVVLGVLLLLFAKKSMTRGIAYTVLGFGILFYGMTVMSAQSRVVAEFPGFQRFFAYFDCTPSGGGTAMPAWPVLGAILIGIVSTVIVQSSSVTVSLTIALAAGGLVNFWTAFPLVLGCNIGSTMTALIASFGTGSAARQTALSSVIFKVLGVALMLVLAYVPWNGVPCFLRLVDALTPGEVFAAHPQEIGRHIANLHTLFSVVTTLVFLPTVPWLAWLARHLVPESREKSAEGICHLEPHLLRSPSAAMDQVLTALLAMTRAAMTLTHNAISAFISRDHTEDEKLHAQEAEIDKAQHEIIDYLIKLTRRNLTETQSSIVPSFMHCVNDVERIGDRAINILQLVSNEDAVSQKFSSSALAETREIGEKLAETGRMLVEGMSRNDEELIDKVIKHCGEIKVMTARFESNHESRLHNQDCNVENGVIYVELLSNLERIAAHLSNLAERARSMLTHRVQFANAAGSQKG